MKHEWDYEFLCRLKAISIIAVLCACLTGLLAMTSYSRHQKYKEVYTRLQEENYTLFIDGDEIDADKIDITLYPSNHISYDDEKKRLSI